MSPSFEPTFYIPLYTLVGNQYAYLWALIPSLAVAYYLPLLIVRRSRLRTPTSMLGFSLFLSGSILLIIAFYSTLTAETMGMDRYLGSPGYLFLALSLVPAMMMLTSVVGSKKFVSFSLLALLIIPMVAIGSNAPDRAVDVHKAVFEPYETRAYSAGKAMLLLPQGTTVIRSKEITVPDELKLEEKDLDLKTIYVSYKPTRNLLLSLESGESSLTDYQNITFILNGIHYPGIKKQSENEAIIVFDDGKYFMAKVD